MSKWPLLFCGSPDQRSWSYGCISQEPWVFNLHRMWLTYVSTHWPYNVDPCALFFEKHFQVLLFLFRENIWFFALTFSKPPATNVLSMRKYIIYSIYSLVYLQTFGIVFDISNAILGLTLLAWGNSIGGKYIPHQSYNPMILYQCSRVICSINPLPHTAFEVFGHVGQKYGKAVYMKEWWRAISPFATLFSKIVFRNCLYEGKGE